MKRYSLVMFMLMVFSLPACGGSPDSNVKSQAEITKEICSARTASVEPFRFSQTPSIMNSRAITLYTSPESPILKTLRCEEGEERKYSSHPLLDARKMIRLLDCGEVEAAEYIAQNSLANATVINDSEMYIPYQFDFKLHARCEAMKAPWYSGIAQGVMLAAFTRLYQETGNSDYLVAADRIFNTFHVKGSTTEPWITMVDEGGYYWIEEYPDANMPTHVLNGHVWAIFGLYEYWLETGRGAYLIDSAITTARHYSMEYYNENGLSYYCMSHTITSKKYHEIHIEIFELLYDITRDRYFLKFADALRQAESRKMDSSGE